MSDESPVDLKTLEPADPPDLVGPAVRRFRWRVVLFTVVTVVVVSGLSAWLAATLAKDDSPGYVEAITTPEQAAILYGAGICRTPSFRVGGTEVALIGAATMPTGEMALHFIVHGNKPVTEQRDQPDGSSFARFTSITSSAQGSSVGWVGAQPGAKWGEAFMHVPATSGDQLEMTVTGPDQESQTFSVDLTSLDCTF
jgi:hypothetical protein